MEREIIAKPDISIWIFYLHLQNTTQLIWRMKYEEKNYFHEYSCILILKMHHIKFSGFVYHNDLLDVLSFLILDLFYLLEALWTKIKQTSPPKQVYIFNRHLHIWLSSKFMFPFPPKLVNKNVWEVLWKEYLSDHCSLGRETLQLVWMD